MNNKSEMFKGLTASDFHPTFRADLAAFGALSPDDGITLAQILIDDARNLVPANFIQLSKGISKKLGTSATQSSALARSIRSLASRYSRSDDNPAFIVDDLIQMEVLPQTSRNILLQFLTALRQQRDELVKRSVRQQTIFGGGAHLGNCSVFTDCRAAFDKYDLSGVDLDTYQPTLTGLIPIVNLVLEIHEGDKEKTITIRLPEQDLARIEEVLRMARLQLAALKKQLAAGEK